MRLIAIKKIHGRIRLRSGLHIGAGKDNVEIGGLDQPIIKNPLTNEPYIPGSSLRGKMRSMLETSLFQANPGTRAAVQEGKPCNCGRKDCPACTIFGAYCNSDSEAGISRLLVRDAMLTAEYSELFRTGELPMEVKNENTINRLKGTADNPRPLERVPAGVCFSLDLALRVYEGDGDELLGYVLSGLKLMEMDAIGGGGSRGNGQIAIEDLTVDGKAVTLEDVVLS